MEVLIVLLITIVVLGTVVQLSRVARLLHSREVRRTERAAAGLRAAEEIARELRQAGLGLGDDVAAVLAEADGSPPSPDRVTIRSSPYGTMGILMSNVVPGVRRIRVAGAGLFHAGDRVLLTDTRGPPLATRVVAADDRWLTLGDVSAGGGRPRVLLATHAGRVRRVREVSYFPLRPAPDAPATLARRIDEDPVTIVVRGLERVRFEYRDEAGSLLDPRRLPRTRPRLVTLELALDPARELPPLRVPVAVGPQAGRVAFDEAPARLRFRRLLVLPGAVDIGSAPWAPSGLVLFRDEVNHGSRLFSFDLEPGLLSLRVETVIELPRVPEPRALVLAADEAAPGGRAWIAAEGGGGLEAWRLRPDPTGGLSSASPLERVLVAKDIRDVVGAMADGLEDSLLVAQRKNPSVVRVRPGASARSPLVERLAELDGLPVALAGGRDGSPWVLLARSHPTESGARLVRIGLADGGNALPPRIVATLPGEPRGLAVDPVGGALYALVTADDDSLLYEVSPDAWSSGASGPVVVFRLSEWTDAVHADPSRLARRAPPPDAEDGEPSVRLLPRRLRGVAFDGRGSLFLIAEDAPMVLEFTLGRPRAARHWAGIAAVAVQTAGDGSARLRLLGWARSPLAP